MQHVLDQEAINGWRNYYASSMILFYIIHVHGWDLNFTYILELCDKPKLVNQIDCYYSPCVSSSKQDAPHKKKHTDTRNLHKKSSMVTTVTKVVTHVCRCTCKVFLCPISNKLKFSRQILVKPSNIIPWKFIQQEPSYSTWTDMTK